MGEREENFRPKPLVARGQDTGRGHGNDGEVVSMKGGNSKDGEAAGMKGGNSKDGEAAGMKNKQRCQKRQRTCLGRCSSSEVEGYEK